MKLLEIRYILSEIKIILHVIKNKLDTTEKISKHKDVIIHKMMMNRGRKPENNEQGVMT